MNFKIGNVKLNMEFYVGKDQYTDGDVEDEILGIVKEDIPYDLSSENRWPFVYHLSPERRNLLEWYDFNNKATLLEIGGGCGALTGLFCEKINNVISVELSQRRSLINAHQNKEKSNLEIIVGNFNDIKFDNKFDYVSLIGVLEYAKMYSYSDKPYLHFLKKISRNMKKDATLILAIENKFGLKYWAGAEEDHTGKAFEGLEGYTEYNNIITFSKQELANLLKTAGYYQIDFYYPLPDYKFCNQIFSDDFLPSLEHQYTKYWDKSDKLFNENLVFNNLVLNNKFDFFANSFLVFAKNGDTP